MSISLLMKKLQGQVLHSEERLTRRPQGMCCRRHYISSRIPAPEDTHKIPCRSRQPIRRFVLLCNRDKREMIPPPVFHHMHVSSRSPPLSLQTEYLRKFTGISCGKTLGIVVEIEVSIQPFPQMFSDHGCISQQLVTGITAAVAAAMPVTPKVNSSGDSCCQRIKLSGFGNR